MTDTTPWHEGERAVQRRLGFAEHAEARGVNIRDFMPEQHRAFFAQLPFAVLGALDPVGNPWATVLTGGPGFLSSPNPKILHIGAYPQDGDPAASGILPGARIGLLGIELSTRRRNRMNGRVIDIDVSGFTVMVEQSFGNCPQYIQRRDYGRRRRPSFPEAEPLAFGDAWAMSLIAGADTAFVASSTPPGTDQSGGGADVSHRGGRPASSGPAKTACSKSRITAATAFSTPWATCSPIRAPACRLSISRAATYYRLPVRPRLCGTAR